MAYMLLILEPHGQRGARSDAQGRDAYAQMERFGAGLAARGVLRAGESLRTDTQGVRVQVRNTRRTLIDSPFTEAKEMIGGFFLLDGVSREEAIAIAGECPAAQWATVEVREIAPCYAD